MLIIKNKKEKKLHVNTIRIQWTSKSHKKISKWIYKAIL